MYIPKCFHEQVRKEYLIKKLKEMYKKDNKETQAEQLPQDAVITRFNFDDLSFSGIVNEIDGDEQTCKEFIIEAYYKIEKQRKIVEEIKRNLHNEESYLRSLENSIDLAMKHLSLQKPFALIIDKGTYNELLVISDSAVTLEKNVL